MLKNNYKIIKIWLGEKTFQGFDASEGSEISFRS